ncbi:GerMN domain-containing protein [Clostridium lacusfryxellense]|uniref:GerMN domain-containing protein n=1 Tax=Clostridium lacusfryxellense TaxID=205328 RepID=UPI001C0CE563|nr:GerMN domain-containing protein [Clostridium lacusfryxellense]MBU3112474.1 GerMN domain-containing protein [Clostridium lacusfryxellense]
MKKMMLITSLTLSLVLLSGCAAKSIVNSDDKKNTVPKVTTPSVVKTVPKETKALPTIKDYFDYKENTKYVYEGKGNEYAAKDVSVDYLTGNRVQLRSSNGGTVMGQVLENKNGQIIMMLSKEEFYYRENLTQKPSSKEEILLKEPLVKGTAWTLADNRKRYISNVDIEVTTPLGKYKTLEVTTQSKDSKTLDYYAQNVGLVKSLYIAEGMEVSTTLSRIEKNVKFTQDVNFYYPNVDEDKLYFVNKKLSFNTNDITKIVIEKAFKELPKGNFGKVLSPNTKIKSLYLNKDNIVYVDFTKELTSEMNAGSGYESMILQSITNTLGTYYGVNKVYITIEGSPYSSGHILMKKGEYFTVNTKNSIELK